MVRDSDSYRIAARVQSRKQLCGHEVLEETHDLLRDDLRHEVLLGLIHDLHV